MSNPVGTSVSLSLTYLWYISEDHAALILFSVDVSDEDTEAIISFPAEAGTIHR